MTRRQNRGAGLGVIALAFVAGMMVDSWLRVYGPPLPVERGAQAGQPVIAATPAEPRIESTSRPIVPVATTGRNKLRLPIDGANVDAMKGGFAEARTGHAHEAVDILAPRNTPIHAVDAGTIAKLFVSKLGGNTVYQFDPSGRLAYYYAHLERYADGLREGEAVRQGDLIGYVGTSGNAPANTPHLHFAVFELGPERQWWKGKPIDPYEIFR